MNLSAANPTVANRRFFNGRFIALIGLGILGGLTTLLLPLNLPPEAELPLSETAIRLIGLVQTLVLISVAVILGQATAPRVGLGTPFIDRLLSGTPSTGVLKEQLAFGAIWGIISAGLIALLQWATLPLMPATFTEAAATAEMPILVRLLYGGITEEILLRWGMMSLFVWGIYYLARLFNSAADPVAPAIAWPANIIAALLFGLGHLPAVISLAGGESLTLSLILVIVGLNALFGLGAGWLYWRKGLEAAMWSHIIFHVVVVLGGWVVGLL